MAPWSASGPLHRSEARQGLLGQSEHQCWLHGQCLQMMHYAGFSHPVHRACKDFGEVSLGLTIVVRCACIGGLLQLTCRLGLYCGCCIGICVILNSGCRLCFPQLLKHAFSPVLLAGTSAGCSFLMHVLRCFPSFEGLGGAPPTSRPVPRVLSLSVHTMPVGPALSLSPSSGWPHTPAALSLTTALVAPGQSLCQGAASALVMQLLERRCCACAGWMRVSAIGTISTFELVPERALMSMEMAKETLCTGETLSEMLPPGASAAWLQSSPCSHRCQTCQGPALEGTPIPHAVHVCRSVESRAMPSK